jgi:DNA-binding NtrC family response regulator
MAHLLLIDDDPNTLASLSRAFRLAGHAATVCDSARRAVELISQHQYDVVLSDVVMPGTDGLALLEQLKNLGVETPVVMISGQATVEMAVRATKLGAVDFLEKPLSTDKLLLTVENALKLTRLERENRELRERVGSQEIVWRSETMRRLMAQLDRVAASETRVCILGETGTGKELVARALHQRSARAEGAFVTLNCAAVPAELIESELFGHEKGAFTGAGARQSGKFERAHGGTLFLDEIGDMPLMMQAKLLRVLQEGEFERVGGDRPVAVNVRVLVATHRDLPALVRTGTFREDLFHRIYVFPLTLPPLRDRPEDIAPLVEHFTKQISAQNGWRPKAIEPAALELLRRYAWPGNIRELRNVVERLLLLADAQIGAECVRLALPAAPATEPADPLPVNVAAQGALADRVAAFEKAALLEELTRHGFRMSDTARALGLERSHLYKKCQQHGIDLRGLRGG